MVRNGCIFCGNRPTTREHTIPRWAYGVLSEDPRGIAPDSAHSRHSSTGMQQDWRSANPIDFVANCVCKACNSGWMSDIETAAQLAISAMIRGEPVALNRQNQDQVAAWLGLKAIVQRYGQSPPLSVPREWLDHYHTHHRAPDSWTMRISRYAGDRVVRMTGADGTAIIRNSLAPFPVQQAALMFSIAIGHFFGQVLGVRQQTAVGGDQRLFAEIWPHPILRLGTAQLVSPDLVAWPPEGSLNDSDFDRYGRDPAGTGR